MGKKLFILVVCGVVCMAFIGFASENDVKLPAPQMSGGKPLMEVLKDRRTIRAFSSKEIPPQVLSNLLWAADGVNRPDSGKRTAPSAVNWQEIDVYVALAKGVYLYNPERNILSYIKEEDIRADVGVQSFTQEAPVNLIYVADYAKMGNATAEQKDFYSATDTGFISQNVYLFCASQGLSTVVLGMVDKNKLAVILGLREDQKIILTQPVGYSEEY